MEMLLNYLQQHALQIASTISIVFAIWKGRYIAPEIIKERTEKKISKLSEKIEKKKSKMQAKYKILIDEQKELKGNDNSNT